MTLAAPRVATVLLVDDVDALRHLVRISLEASGSFIVVGEAGDGLEAVELAGRLRPDVVLLDLSMPRMDGLEALPRILAVAPETKVVVLSGFEARRVGPTALERGAIACLEKGIPAHELPGRLLDLLG